MELDGIEWVLVILVGLLLILIGFAIGDTIKDKNIILSQETGDKICLDLTNESGVVAKDYEDFGEENKPIERGELYCQVPSYDKTHLIKVGK